MRRNDSSPLPPGSCAYPPSVVASAHKFRRELKAGLTSLIVLAVLAHSDGPLHGYAVAKRLKESTQGMDVRRGAIYPVLRHLEAGGLASSCTLGMGARPPRRCYAINDPGREALALWTEAWRQTSRALDAIVEEQPGDS